MDSIILFMATSMKKQIDMNGLFDLSKTLKSLFKIPIMSNSNHESIRIKVEK